MVSKKRSGNHFPKRGEVYWVDLEPTRGNEAQKRRPGLVISNDIGNEFSPIIMIAPITSKITRVYPTEVKTSVANRDAKIMLHQSRAVDKSRLLNKLGEVTSQTMIEVEKAIRIVFALP
ncbi:MAG: Endoribonuclease EndoA [Chlamydiae bacterium]|nr:Endoribonuclease EndoA [Chlamydiota bacterium]